ncbi:MAG TPA: thioredoxin family protein [Chitinophagaceae bacterium]|jgi:thioredoxin-related protein|nr:thioredoxin family protein [Chitinophagaceae bacterium]
MKKIFLAVLMVAITSTVFSQDLTKFHLYHPEEDATAGIAKAVKEAKKANKHVFIQVGGNWCIWCARFNDLVTTDKSLDSALNANYIVYHLNYSKENTNEKILAKYGFPQRFGFPVFLVLDGSGNLLHTQNSSYLEEKKGYSQSTVLGFFNDWSTKAIDPNEYKEQSK